MNHILAYRSDMKAEARRAAIEGRVRSHGEVDFASLAGEFAVSEMTIRRDIEVLEEKGVLRRVAGGAIAFQGRGYEPPFATRVLNAVDQKRHIADAVARLLRQGESVIFDSGSSALAVARAIRGRRLGLTVITPSVLVALELVDEPDTTVIMTGGQVRSGELSLVGPESEASFAGYNCDTYVMGIAGLDGVKGASEYHREEGAMKRAALAAAARVIVPVDASKLGRVHLMHVAPLSAIDVIVSDMTEQDATLAAARRAGVDVCCVTEAAQGGDERP
jgi:DeoR/GlpR family transcriptional regulator of sugar metabolism